MTAATPSQPARLAAVSSTSACSGPLHVLVADDHRATADTTAELLAQSPGWVAHVAYDGGDCLRQACAQRPDAVLLDLRMPVMGGLEVARRIRAHYPGRAPYLIAVTGCSEEVEDLPAIDLVFDRILAKPLDTEVLCDSLQRLARDGQPVEPAALMLVDVAELLTRAARKVAPVAAARSVDLGYDHIGDTILVLDDPVRLHRAFDHLWLGVLDMVRGGSVLLRTQADLRPSGSAALMVDAAATGPLVDASVLDAWLRSVGLDRLAVGGLNGAPVFLLRQGRCPITGALLTCWQDANEGLLLRATLHYAQASGSAAAGRPLVQQATAWVVARQVMPMASEAMRLRRLGWVVKPMDSCPQALDALTAQAGSAAGPDLLLVCCDGAQPMAEVQALAQAMPAGTRCVAGVPSGHPWLGLQDALPGIEVCTLPFSPSDLIGLCQPHRAPLTVARGEGANAGESGAARAGQDTALAAVAHLAGRPADERPLVLVVDDSAVNRLVGRALVEMLGYTADSAHDGLDAIDHCRRHPPDCVLMDVDMPVLGGIDAAARLRDLQRSGELPLFPVIAATADAEAEAACRAAGMDAFLLKPLDLHQLRALLHRFTDDVTVR